MSPTWYVVPDGLLKVKVTYLFPGVWSTCVITGVSESYTTSYVVDTPYCGWATTGFYNLVFETVTYNYGLSSVFMCNISNGTGSYNYYFDPV